MSTLWTFSYTCRQRWQMPRPDQHSSWPTVCWMFSISILCPEDLAGRNLRHMGLSLGIMVGTADLLTAIKHNCWTSVKKMAFSVKAQDVDGLLLQLVDLLGAVWHHVCHSNNRYFIFINMTYSTNNLLSTSFVCHTNMRECKLHCVLSRPLTIVYTKGNVFTKYPEQPSRKLNKFLVAI